MKEIISKNMFWISPVQPAIKASSTYIITITEQVRTPESQKKEYKYVITWNGESYSILTPNHILYHDSNILIFISPTSVLEMKIDINNFEYILENKIIKIHIETKELLYNILYNGIQFGLQQKYTLQIIF